MTIRDLLSKKIRIDKVFVNKNNGQMTICLPRKKVRQVPKRVEVITYW